MEKLTPDESTELRHAADLVRIVALKRSAPELHAIANAIVDYQQTHSPTDEEPG
jgi:hypothetical protein